MNQLLIIILFVLLVGLCTLASTYSIIIEVTDNNAQNEIINQINVRDIFTDTNGNVYTQDQLASLVGDNSVVRYNDETYNVVDKTSDDAKTVGDAQDLVERALVDASSIGGDVSAAEIVGGAPSSTDGDKYTWTITKAKATVQKDLTFSLHVGADADMNNKIIVNISPMDAAGLGIKGINVADNTGMAATYAIDAIADAVAKVSEQRSALGAVQNRLEHTIANLDNVVENTTAAESRIRDTDMAEEMVEYSKNNILAQAGQSMLAQANQSTQGVLSILQ